MSACPACGHASRGEYNRKWYEVKKPVVYEEDKDVHACQPMMDFNRLRDVEGKPHVYLFRDFGESDWTLMTGTKRLGFEYTKVSRCPYCNEEL